MSAEKPDITQANTAEQNRATVAPETAPKTEDEMHDMMREVIEMAQGNTNLKNDLRERNFQEDVKNNALQKISGVTVMQEQSDVLRRLQAIQTRPYDLGNPQNSEHAKAQENITAQQKKASTNPWEYAIDQVIAGHKEAGGLDLTEHKNELMEQVRTEMENRRTNERQQQLSSAAERYRQKIHQEEELTLELEQMSPEIEKILGEVEAQGQRLNGSVADAKNLQQKFYSFAERTGRRFTGNRNKTKAIELAEKLQGMRSGITEHPSFQGIALEDKISAIERNNQNPSAGFPDTFSDTLPQSGQLEASFNSMMGRRQRITQKILETGQKIQEQIKQNKQTAATICPDRIYTWLIDQTTEKRKG